MESNGESEWRLKLLEDEKLLKKEVDNKVIVGNNVWLEVWCQLWRKKTFVMWRLVWMNKKEMTISFKISPNTKVIFLNITLQTGWNWIEKEFIPFQMKCNYHIMVKYVIISFIIRMKDIERWLKEDEFVYPWNNLKKERT